MYYIVLTPPHSSEAAPEILGQVLSMATADAGLLLRNPVLNICAQSSNKAEAQEKVTTLQESGVRAAYISIASLFAIRASVPCTTLQLEEESIVLLAEGSSQRINLSEPFQLIEQNFRRFGTEYQAFKASQHLKKDKKAKRQRADLKALLSDKTRDDSESARTWFFSQVQNQTVQRFHIQTSDILYTMLASDMQVNSKENSKALKKLLQQKAEKMSIDDSLVGISYRYPYLINPSFFQTLETQGLTKELFPPQVLAERLSTAVWLERIMS